MRPLHTWYVNEDPNAKVEIARLETERKNLIPHIPDVLRDIGVEVKHTGIFCCMDGKVA